MCNKPNSINSPAIVVQNRVDIVSHNKIEMKLNPVPVQILEMEDVLFHHDSAVLLPSKPMGKSSDDGGKDAQSSQKKKQQEALTGLEAIAAVFKQLEFDNRLKMLIAAHTDTSGKDKYNFELSDLRGNCVSSVIHGHQYTFSQSCYKKHKIEDYQQIMTHFNKRHPDWDCDPQGVDNIWGDHTEAAMRKFFNAIGLDSGLVDKIKKDSKKRWPEEVWNKISDLYDDELAYLLGLDSGFKFGQAYRWRLRDACDKSYVACGESFPIDAKEKDNYRSQCNRRVEILFFWEEDVEDWELDCPVQIDKKHKAEECPLWNNLALAPTYIDPAERTMTAYHLQFIYYNRVKKSTEIVPEGLLFSVYETDGKTTTKVPGTKTKFHGGIYTVLVPDKPGRTGLHFEIESPDRQWIFTQNKDATPEIKKELAANVAALDFSEQIKYYDLPPKWSSKNYWTRYKGSDDKEKGEFFQKVFADSDKMNLKPAGGKLTSPDKPMIFSFDDFVLTGKDLSPINLPDAQKGKRIALLKSDLAIYNPDTAANFSYYSKDVTSAVHFPAIRDERIAAVIQQFGPKDFRLYAVFSDRVATGDWAGHRAAVYEHTANCLKTRHFQQVHRRCTDSAPWWAIGWFDSYLLRNMDYDFAANEKISYIFNYFRWYFKAKSGVTATGANWQKWISETADNVTKVWNDHEGAGPKLASLFHDDNGDKNRVYMRYHIEHPQNDSDKETLINVYPSTTGGRSNMGQDEGNVREDDNKRDPGPDSGSKDRFVIAHEFGHSTSLDDDYLEVANHCSYYLPGFVDFKLGSPFDADADSMMRGNRNIRPRQYWHFAEWMHKEFDAKAREFAVQMKGKPEYKIPYNADNKWKSAGMKVESKNYYNYPYKTLLNAKNVYDPADPAGNFNLYLYPLGKDDYSEKVLLSGNKFTAVLVIVVNLYFREWHEAQKPKNEGMGKSECAFKNIQDALIKINSGIRLFKKHSTVEIQGDPPFEHTFIHIQPRYLVREYSTDYVKDHKSKSSYQAHVDEILAKTECRAHCTIDVGSETDETAYDSSQTPPHILLQKNIVEYVDFWEYFSRILGLPKGSYLTADNFSVGDFIKKGGGNATYVDL